MKPIAITMGDPCGIGPEICAKLFADGLDIPSFVVGDAERLKRVVRDLSIAVSVQTISNAADCKLQGGVMQVLSVSSLPSGLAFGQVDASAGQAAYDYVTTAVDLAKSGAIGAIVTAPIAKEALKAAGIIYPGHTEILADRSGTSDFAMMLANEELRVILVSIHVSLSEAIKLVTKERVLNTIRLADQACRAYGIRNPRIAVAGLNPHAGENGMFGHEDLSVIAPAVAAAQAEGIEASGPWPGDTVFMRARRGAFDIVVAQYHDQGLIPVKYMGIEHGVNVTVGLPFVRTSVDHGTAFDIAGSGKASHASLRYACDQAVKLLKSKTEKAKRPSPDFIFMLTNQDKTIPDALERLEDVVAAGVTHIGFKDVGLPFDRLQVIAGAIRAAGAKVYLEVVSLDAESEKSSAEAALKLGVDVLMGGTRPAVVLPVINGTNIKYYPFPGQIAGHPSVLEGSIEAIVASAKHLAAMSGVHGLDLLAYRFAGDVPLLMRRVCAAIDKPVIIAGSIDRPERILAAIRSGSAGFTVGTAAFEGKFTVAKNLVGEIKAISDAMMELR
jgi:4-hydroxythreonine-4-phosphate dehydrogenase